MAASRVVLVTGCSSGIGLSTAIELGRAGHEVIATMRSLTRSGTLRAAAATASIEMEVAELDVTDAASIESVVDEVVARRGRIDAIVNNAGVAPFATVEQSSDEEWLATLDTNLLGAVRMARAALPHMRRRGDGVIVNVSSIAGRLAALPTQGAYAASKHALCALADVLVAECGPFGVRSICIEPGFFSTAILGSAEAVAQPAADDPYRRLRLDVQSFFRTSIEDAPPPEEVAHLVVAAVEGRIGPETHHPVGMQGALPTATSARISPPPDRVTPE